MPRVARPRSTMAWGHRALAGLDHGHGHGQPRHGHRQHRPRGRGREPAARAEQVQGASRHGLVPTNCRATATCRTTRRARCSRPLWAGRCRRAGPCASRTCSTKRSPAGSRASTARERTSPSRIPHAACRRGLKAWNASSCRTVPERDREIRPCLPAGSSSREGRHLYQRGAAHQPRPQGDVAARWLADWETRSVSPRRSAIPCATTTPRRSWTRSPGSRRPLPASATIASSSSVSISGPATTLRRKAPDHACRQVRARARQVHDHRVRADGRAHGERFPLILTTGRILSQYNVGAQTRRTDNTIWHHEDVLEIHPFDAENRGVREGDWWAVQSRRGRSRCAPMSPSGCSRGWSTRPSTTPAQAQRRDHRLFGLGDQLPEYKVTAVQVRRTNRLSSWQDLHDAEDRSHGIEGIPCRRGGVRAA